MHPVICSARQQMYPLFCSARQQMHPLFCSVRQQMYPVICTVRQQMYPLFCSARQQMHPIICCRRYYGAWVRAHKHLKVFPLYFSINCQPLVGMLPRQPPSALRRATIETATFALPLRYFSYTLPIPLSDLTETEAGWF